ncbi:MAG: IS3 family transposase, partial [Methylomarinum sp.]|nr:IS3 family transposase [Methylomarinum sp.]
MSRSAYYAWLHRPAKLIDAQELHLYRRCKALFNQSRGSLGTRQLAKKSREEGFNVGRYRTRT